MSDCPRIYIASLADYNCGHLHGIWIDLDDATDLDDVMSQIQEMLSASLAVVYGETDVAEDFAIHDFDNFYGYEVREYTPLEDVLAVAAGIAKHGETFAQYVQHCGYANPSDAAERFEDLYIGTWESGRDYASEMFEDLDKVAYDLVTGSEWLTFDPDAYIRADECDGYLFLETADGVAVFSPDR